MVDWQDVKKRVLFGKLPAIGQHADICDDVLMAQHSAFWAPGGAGRIQDNGEVIRRTVLGPRRSWPAGDKK